jgi:hypothetical protein
MFNEAQQLAIVRTELDEVFYQEFNYEDGNPVMTNCKNALIFKQETTDKAFDIEEVYKGVNLFPIITETQTVPTSTPKVANKITTQIKDFAESVELSKDLFDDNIKSPFWSLTLQLV